MRPLCVDLFCGLGGFSAGFLANGYRCIGFDIEAHEYAVPDVAEGDGTKGTKPIEKRGWTQGCAVSLGMEGANNQPRTRLLEYPGKLILRDVRTIHGSELADAAIIVASPPCQEYSYMAMPWSKAKTKVKFYEENPEAVGLLNELFNECFRIQREAIAATGHHIPMIVENVKGAERWVGRARWHFGSFYLWGDVPALMPMTFKRKLKTTGPVTQAQADNHNCHINEMRDSLKGPGGDWFKDGRQGQDACLERIDAELRKSVKSGEPVKLASFDAEGRMTEMCGQKVPGFRFDGTGKSFQTASVEGRKNGNDWFGSGENCSLQRRASSKSSARKAASARIAVIPFALSDWIARAYYPREKEASA